LGFLGLREQLDEPYCAILLAASALALAACDGESSGSHVTNIPYCNDTPVARITGKKVSTVTYHLGNEDQRAAPPVRTVSDPDAIKAVITIVTDLDGYWYQPAGETYDPASIRKIGETTAVFMDGDKEHGFIAIGVNSIEGPGCGTHLIRQLMAKDRSTLLNAIGHPVP
jgi:hypothetical protein